MHAKIVVVKIMDYKQMIYSKPKEFEFTYDQLDSIQSILGKINTLFQPENLRIREEDSKIKLEYHKNSLHQIILDDSLALILGMDASYMNELDETNLIVSSFPPDTIDFGELFVYTDIIKSQYLGDVMAKVLRVVGLDYDRNVEREYVGKLFDSPHYIPLERNNIDTIQIHICDKLGRTINFTKGTVIVKLHFRRSYF